MFYIVYIVCVKSLLDIFSAGQYDCLRYAIRYSILGATSLTTSLHVCDEFKTVPKLKKRHCLPASPIALFAFLVSPLKVCSWATHSCNRCNSSFSVAGCGHSEIFRKCKDMNFVNFCFFVFFFL